MRRAPAADGPKEWRHYDLPEGKLEALVELLRPMGIQEIVRTGKVAISRGPKTRTRKAETPRPRPRVEDPRVVGFAD